MMFKLWCRLVEPNTDPWSKCWTDMSYAPRGRYDCDKIIRLYRERYGDRYEYTYFPVGMNPPGCVIPQG